MAQGKAFKAVCNTRAALGKSLPMLNKESAPLLAVPKQLKYCPAWSGWGKDVLAWLFTQASECGTH